MGVYGQQICNKLSIIQLFSPDFAAKILQIFHLIEVGYEVQFAR